MSNAKLQEINIASQKCAEAAGFQHEGLKRESVAKLGKYLNSGVYGVLERDFAALHTLTNLVY